MKRLTWLLLLIPALALSQTAQGPFGIFGGPIPSTLLAPAAQVPINTYAFTTDQGLLVNNGSAWVSASSTSGSAFSGLTSGDNTVATMTCDSGCNLSWLNSGIITATSATGFTSSPSPCSGGQFVSGITAPATLVCGTPTGSGTVNTGLTGNLAYYASNTTAVSPLVVGSNTLLGGVGSGVAALTPAQVIGVLGSGTCNPQTISYTLVLGDENSCVTENSGSATTVTIPLNSSVAFPVGTSITVQQLGAGTVSVAIAGGVTIQQAGAISYASLGGQFGFESFQKVATDTWQLSGQGLGNTKFTVGGTCSAPTTAGGATGGTITLPASGTTASCTLIVTPGGGLATANLWVGRMCDRTQLTVPCWGESASNTTTITFTIPAATAASDVLTFDAKAE